jgi:hypothetical protein
MEMLEKMCLMTEMSLVGVSREVCKQFDALAFEAEK